jgi:hypothetical protein
MVVWCSRIIFPGTGRSQWSHVIISPDKLLQVPKVKFLKLIWHNPEADMMMVFIYEFFNHFKGKC